jgi:hypothetical protein
VQHDDLTMRRFFNGMLAIRAAVSNEKAASLPSMPKPEARLERQC